MLIDFIAKQPSSVIGDIELTDTTAVFPAAVDPVAFHRDFQAEINSSEFTDEKAIYIGSKHTTERRPSVSSLLLNKVKY